MAPTLPSGSYYYDRNQLTNFKSVNYDNEIVSSLAYKKFQQTQLYSDASLTVYAGSIFYDISVLDLPGSVNTSYDSELGTIFFLPDSSNNTITFTVSLFNPNTASFLDVGTYDFPITGGSGIYLSAVGHVHVVVNTSGLRTLTFSNP